MRKNLLLLALGLTCITAGLHAQSNAAYWQQEVDYKMEIDMNVKNFQYDGKQSLTYTNHSPDTLNRVFYHMYFNAFQPGSEMDARLQSIKDPDRRMTSEGKSRIASLSPEEIGFLRVESLKQDGAAVAYSEEETILVVDLAKPLMPGASTQLDMVFKGQVPVQIRRSGRNSAEGVALSMSQWYPKLAEYDAQGWHPNPYIAREFHGVWGDFDVKITIDSDYTIGGTGYLQNPNEIGHGYEAKGTKLKRKKKKQTWHFKAPMVHDFMWGADPNYVHDVYEMPNGPTLHFFYKNDPELKENWTNLQPKTAAAMEFFSKNIGQYPYDQYSVVQGGDGGMEYAMSTLITGKRSFNSLVGVMVHELAHSWFQHVLATNESKYEWMDEGFTSFISSLCMNEIMEQNRENPFTGSYGSYLRLATSGVEHPQTTHADRYELNGAYGASAYSKGSVFLAQLAYVIGQENLMESIKRYFHDFKFKHPVPNDFKRSAEKVSGMQLDWYLTDWTQTTNTIDYGIESLNAREGGSTLNLKRIGLMPMPLDVVVVKKDGTAELFYIPLRMMRGEKENPYPQMKRTLAADWAWAYPTYSLELPFAPEEIEQIVVDPSNLMADVDRDNNVYQGQ